MSARADKTLHWKISGNINDTDTFSPYPFLKNVIFRHEFVHKFKYEIRKNSSKFVQIRMNFLHEKLVMLRMACTVHVKSKFLLKYSFDA